MSNFPSLVSYGEKKQIGTVDESKGELPEIKFEKEEIDPENQTLKEFLDTILPPKQIVENGILFCQFVSNDSAIVNDVIKLSNELDTQLKERGAKEKGICPIRETLYNECFDEIIREVSIGCIQRGALLNRIKREANYTINYYQKLYESLISFSMRKVLQEKKKFMKLENKKNQLNDEIEKLNNEIEDINKDFENYKQKHNEDEELDKQNFLDSVKNNKKEIQEKTEKATSILTKPSEDYMGIA